MCQVFHGAQFEKEIPPETKSARRTYLTATQDFISFLANCVFYHMTMVIGCDRFCDDPDTTCGQKGI